MASSSSQQILWREHYAPYGEKLNGVADKIGYTGHAFDSESGLTYAQARYYDAAIGRFLSTDPIGFQESNPFSFNRYAYANNNPYRYTDPTGMEGNDLMVEKVAQEMRQRDTGGMGGVAGHGYVVQFHNDGGGGNGSGGGGRGQSFNTLPNGEAPLGPFEPPATRGEIDKDGQVQRNEAVTSNIETLRTALDIKGYKAISLTVTGGESYVAEDGTVRSVTNGSIISKRLANSAHNIENGSRAIDLRAAMGIDHGAFIGIVTRFTQFTNNTNKYDDLHEHLGLPNRPEFNCAVSICTKP